MARHIKRVVKDIDGESEGHKQSDKESWWWNEDLQTIIKDKRIT